MRVKLKAFSKKSSSSVLVLRAGGTNFILREPGDVSPELSDADGHKLLADHPTLLEAANSAPERKKRGRPAKVLGEGVSKLEYETKVAEAKLPTDYEVK